MANGGTMMMVVHSPTDPEFKGSNPLHSTVKLEKKKDGGEIKHVSFYSVCFMTERESETIKTNHCLSFFPKPSE